MPKLKTRPGFTFIELLITIALLGILAGMIAYSMGGQQRKARDAQRKSDFQQIKRAMEAARNDCDNGIYFPLGASADFNSTADFLANSGTKYMDKSVRDPKNTTPYIYTMYIPVGPANNVCADASGGKTTEGIRTFLIRTQLEITKDPDANKSRISCASAISNVTAPAPVPALDDGYFYACPD